MNEKIKDLSEKIYEDISELRCIKQPSERIALEIMSLNALINAANFLKTNKTAE